MSSAYVLEIIYIWYFKRRVAENVFFIPVILLYRTR